MRKSFALFFVFLFTIGTLLAGCSSLPSAKESLEDSFDKTLEAESYAFDTSFSLNLSVPEELVTSYEEQMVFNMLKDAEVNVSGVYQKNPYMIDSEIDVSLKGALSMNLTVPFVMTENKMWVQVPSIPMAQLPDGLEGSWIEFDFEELEQLAAQTGEEVVLPNSDDYELAEEFGKEFTSLLWKHFDEEEYFEVMKGKDTEIEGIDHAVIFEVKDEQLESTVTTVINDFLPDMLALFGEDKYADLTGISEEDLEVVKAELEAEKAEIDEAVAELNETVSINTLEYLHGVNKDGYVSYQKVDVNLNVNDDFGSADVGFIIETNSYNFNNVDENISTPSGDNVIPFQQLMEFFMYGY
ncbi:hypothetical protein [Salirhabdus salicampi]|uniref:hypothetical protein n=1 Tax=Salirhabdus salicampi TaxID=476102 RepID=UPI0020C1E0F6|nr:hypothetical protein [Salirhabdus salicampi]MCP8617858.1 hypothetical protein [Salirhabdus salicampi]